MKNLYIIVLLIFCSNLARTQVVDNVRFEQRTDGSLLVDIYYNLDKAGGLPVAIALEASNDDGVSWNLPCTSLSGDVGLNIFEGSGKHVVWDFYADNPNTSGEGYRVRVWADIDLCGQTITKDLTLNKDLSCPFYAAPAILIRASNITLDLGGHSILGDQSHGYHEGIIAEDVDDITIRNGSMEGFFISIILGRSRNSTIENLTITNLEIDNPDIAITAVLVGESDNITIQDCQFEFLQTHHKEAVINSNSNVNVRNIETLNGSVGVNFGGSKEFQASTGSVINCKFTGTAIAGVLIQRCDSALIANNIFENSSISLDPAMEGIVHGITIDRNELHGIPKGEAIYFRGGTESIISNNIVRNNGTGIALTPSRGCGPDSLIGAQCSYATANLIIDNVVLDNTLDLYHDDKCLGNTWQRNTFETAHGIEIYTADPTTAKEFYFSVDSTARTIAADAQLMFLFATSKDTIGKSIKWIYIFQSAEEQRNFELWYHNGKVIQRNTVSIPFMINDGNLPIINPWIDSDAAIVIADEMGGKEFRDSNEIIAIEMSLSQTYWLFWQVNYIGLNASFGVNFDASLE